MDEIEELINQANNAVDVVAKDSVSKLIDQSNKKASGSKSNIIGFNTPIGESRLDEGFLPNMQSNLDGEFELDLNDYRSKKQGVTEKVVKGLGRVVNKVGIEIAKLPGYIGGAVGGVFAEEGQGMDTFVNNAWIKAIEGYEDFSTNEMLPVYTKKAVVQGNLWDNISSIDFWATEGSDGLGFMLSMMAPGAAMSKAGLGGKLLAGLGKTPKGSSILSKMDEASQLLGLEGAGKAIDLGLATTVNTLFEAGSEANGAMKSIEIDLKRKVEAGEMTQAEADLKRAQVGRDVFVTNVGILALPNLILNKQLLGVSKQSKQLSKFKVADNEITENIAKKGLFEKVWKSKGLAILGKDVPREALEELSQSTAEEYWAHNDTFKASEFFETMLDVSKTVEGQKAMLLGGLFGGLGGAGGAYLQSKNNKKRTNSIIDAMNSSVNFYEKSLTGFLKYNEDGTVKYNERNEPEYDYGKLEEQSRAVEQIEKLNQTLQLAKETGNNQLYSLTKDKIETDLISTFIKAGEDGIQVLKEKLEESELFSQELEAANEKLGETTTKESSINSILEKANQTLKDYSFFNNYGKVLSGFKVSKENKGFYNNFIENLNNAYISTVSQTRETSKLIDELKSIKSKLESELNLEDGQSDVIIDNVNKEISELEQYKNILTEQRKDILNGKKQKEAFNELLKEEGLRQEIIDKAAEEASKEPSVEQQEEIEANKKETEESFNKEKENKANIKVAKDESNKFHDVLEELFNNNEAYDLVKDKKTGSVSNAFSNKHLKAIRNHIPELTSDDLITISKNLNDEGIEVFDITVDSDNGIETIRVEKFNIKEEENEVSSEENINNNDSEANTTDNTETTEELTESQILAETNEKDKESINKKHVKTVNSSDPLMTSPLYKDYKDNPIDKTNNKVTFTRGYSGTNELAKEALELLNNILSNNFDATGEQKNFLIKHLPIKVNFDNNIFTHLFNEDGSGKYLLNYQEIQLRQNIVNKALNDKSFENISSEIKFQYPGAIQLDHNEGIISNNSLLEVYGINNLSDIEFVYTGKGQVFKDVNGDTHSIAKATKKAKTGQIFMLIPMANGKQFPLKLNSRRINNQEADTILNIVEKMLDFKQGIKFETNISKNEEKLGLTKEDITLLKEEAKALNKKYNGLRITDFLGSLIFDGNSTKNKFKIKGSNLVYGDTSTNLVNFEDRKDDIKTFLTTQKNRNIRVNKLMETPYKKHIVETVLSTDVKLGEPIFQGNTDIYVSSIIFEGNKPIQNNKEASKKIKATKNRGKGRGKKLGNLRKGLNQMKKDDDQNSNTIC